MLAKAALAVGALLLVLLIRAIVTSIWWRFSDRLASPSGGAPARRRPDEAPKPRVIRSLERQP